MSDSTTDKTVGCLFAFAMLPINATARGYVLSVLWGWFMVPYLHLPSISIPVALGVSCVVGLLTINVAAKTDDNPPWVTALMGLVVSAFALGYGWIVRMFL